MTANERVTAARTARLKASGGRKGHLTGSSGPAAAGGDAARAPADDGANPNPLAPGLYVVATPIGNLEDITRRAERILAGVDLVVCEDSRVTGKLLRHLGVRRPMAVYNEHSAAKRRPELLRRLRDGARLALVSDAGTPAVSDPGFKLIREATENGVTVIPVPGPSAALAALVASGLPTDRFLFAGFLPSRDAARRATLTELAAVPATLVLFESAQRLAAALADAAAILGDRPAVVARELTKLHEEVRRDRLLRLAENYRGESPPRGEVALVIGPPDAARSTAPDQATVDRLLADALARHKPRVAAAEVAAVTGLPANELYRLALQRRAR